MADIKDTIKVSVESSGGVREECTHEHILESDPFINDETCRLMEIIFYAIVCFSVCVVGCVANIINIIIFFKQGFNDSVNISLCFLTISDLCLLLTLTWMSICFNPMFKYSDIEFDSVQIQYITAGYPSDCFARTTSWITAFITFERCVCIALPLKVKDIITPKRTFISVVGIFPVMAASVTPAFCSVKFTHSFNIERNKTLLGLSFGKNAAVLEHVSFYILVVSQICFFIIVIVCLVILIYNLRIKSQWRQKACGVSSLSNSDSLSSRDKRVIKMVTFISCIFILCYFPDTLNVILVICFTPDYSFQGRYQNTFNVSWAIINTLKAVNSCINILVYYHMSSKFRLGFRKLFSANNRIITTDASGADILPVGGVFISGTVSLSDRSGIVCSRHEFVTFNLHNKCI